MTSEQTTPAGWYPAPHANGELRYWDGSRWLEGAPNPPAAPKAGNPVGIIALVAAIAGAVFACVPGALIVGWILLPAAFVLAIVGVALPRKAHGASITALIISIVGTVAGFVVFFGLLGAAFSSSFGSGSSGSGDGSDTSDVSLPAGFDDTGAGVAIRFVSDPSCGDFIRCSQVELIALRDCPNSVYVEAHMLDAAGRNLGITNDMLGSLREGERGIVDLMILKDAATRIELSDVSCY